MYLKKIRLTSEIMEATGRVINRKYLTLETKQSKCSPVFFKNIWEANGQNFMPVYRMVGEVLIDIFKIFNLFKISAGAEDFSFLMFHTSTLCPALKFYWFQCRYIILTCRYYILSM
jgi:hypothetical protein